MKYVFTEYRRRENTALNKAPDDVLRVAKGLGFEDFPVKACGPRRPTFFCKVIARIAWCFEEARISRALKRGEFTQAALNTALDLFSDIGKGV